MDALVITWRELLIAVILASLIYLLEVAVFSQRRSASAAREPMSESTMVELGRLREEIAALHQRIEALELRLAPATSERPEEDTPYGRAVRLASEGLTAQELASRCGISRGEAELIIALKRAASG